MCKPYNTETRSLSIARSINKSIHIFLIFMHHCVQNMGASAMALAMCLTIITITSPAPTPSFPCTLSLTFCPLYLLVFCMYYKRNAVLFKASVYDPHSSFCSFLE